MAFALFMKSGGGILPIGTTGASLQQLLSAPREVLKTTESREPYTNIYFSTYNVGAEWEYPRLRARQDFINQDIIPFDIDKVTWPEDKYAHCEALVRSALTDTGISYDDVAVVCSGNGVQFFVQITVPLVDPQQYDKLKLSYIALIKRMQGNIKPIDSSAHVDASVWSRARIMRVPGTLNEKPDKPVVEAFTVKSTINPIESPLHILVEEYKEEDQEIPISRIPDPDTDSVLENCGFLNWCYDNQEKVTEPQWLAMLGIVGRLDDGENLAHKFSSKHPQYNSAATETKLAHALEYGPRTCANISTMYDGCTSCPQWGKCTSPIAIKGDLWCGTKDTGFYTLVFDADGNIKSQKPDRNGLARYLIKTEKLKSTGDTVYKWDGDKYVGMDDQLLLGYIHTMYRPLPATLGIAKETLDLLMAHNKAVVDRNEDISTRYLNFKNGILDKKENVLLEKTDRYFFRYCLDFNYDSTARCPKFEEYLQQVTMGNQELVQTLLEFGGYALSGDQIWEHKALILHGDGGNGKSTYMNVLRYLAGETNSTALGIRKLAEPNTARLIEGKLFNAADETPVDAFRKYAELFKNLVAGGLVDAHKKYHDSYEFTNRAKIIFSCNDLPGISGFDSGIIRRLILVPFDASFIDVDNKFLFDELKREAPGIFNKMWSAYLVAKERKGIFVPSASEMMIKNLRYDSNPVVAFIEDRCEITGSNQDSISNKDFFTAYTNFCHEYGIKAVLNRVYFFRTIHGLFARDKRVTICRDKTSRSIIGLKLLAEEEF